MIDSLYIPVFIAILIIVLFFGIFIATQIFQTLPLEQETKNSSLENIKNAGKIFFYIVYFGFPVASIILALISGGSNLMLIFSLFLLIINVFLSSLMKNIIISSFEGIEEVKQFISSDAVMSKLIEFYPIIMFVFGLIVIFAQFFV